MNVYLHAIIDKIKLEGGQLLCHGLFDLSSKSLYGGNKFILVIGLRHFKFTKAVIL